MFGGRKRTCRRGGKTHRKAHRGGRKTRCGGRKTRGHGNVGGSAFAVVDTTPWKD